MARPVVSKPRTLFRTTRNWVKQLLLIAGCAAFVATGLWLSRSEDPWILGLPEALLGWITVALFGVFLLIALIEFLHPVPRVRATEGGVWVRISLVRGGYGPIPWSYIAGFRMRGAQGYENLGVVIFYPDRLMQEIGKPATLWGRRKLSGPLLTVPMSMVMETAAHVETVLEALRKAR